MGVGRMRFEYALLGVGKAMGGELDCFTIAVADSRRDIQLVSRGKSLSIDFLRPEYAEIRHQIRGILDSYSHDWDLLSELAQNSVDAVREAGPTQGEVELTVDVASRTVVFQDNGTGIEADQVERLLRPFGTGKTGKPGQLGEKGVGLKLVIFSSSDFKLESTTKNGSCSAQIKGAAGWLNSYTKAPLELDLRDADGAPEIGTRISFELADHEHPLLTITFEELLFLLRTKTALGDCGFIWGGNPPAQMSVTMILADGKKYKRTIECKYLLPTEKLKASDFESLDEFEHWLQEKDRSDAEKRTKLFNKLIVHSGQYQQGNRVIRYWSCFVPSRDFWRSMSNIVLNRTVDGAQADGEQEDAQIGFSGGLVTATKGMPTGIALELVGRGSAGYLPNFFMLVDDPSLRFDIGRKAIHGRQQGILKELAFTVFRAYINKVRKYMGGDVDPDESAFDREELLAEIADLPELGSTQTSFIKRPNSQEAVVSAIFYEQLGLGKFSNVRPLTTGYKGRYDLYARWGKRTVVIEFKYDLSSLIRDFGDAKKLFDEVQILVLWTINEKDRTLAASRAISIEKLEQGSFSKDTRFPHATQRLTLGGVNPIFVVELEQLVSKKDELE